MPPVGQRIAWSREGLAQSNDLVHGHSAEHVARMARGGADRTLCGARIRWSFLSGSNGERCGTCFSYAADRGFVDEYGDPIT